MKPTRENIITAINTGDIETLKAIPEGTNLNFQVDLHTPPLLYELCNVITKLNNPDLICSMFIILINHGLNPNEMYNLQSIFERLCWIAEEIPNPSILIPIAKILIESGVNIYLKDDRLTSPLARLLTHNVTKLLVALQEEKIVNISQQNQFGATVLHEFLLKTYPDIQGIANAIALGVSLDALYCGCSALILAVASQRYLAAMNLESPNLIIQLLLEAGAKPIRTASSNTLKLVTHFKLYASHIKDEVLFQEFCNNLADNNTIEQLDIDGTPYTTLSLTVDKLRILHQAMITNQSVKCITIPKRDIWTEDQKYYLKLIKEEAANNSQLGKNQNVTLRSTCALTAMHRVFQNSKDKTEKHEALPQASPN